MDSKAQSRRSSPSFCMALISVTCLALAACADDGDDGAQGPPGPPGPPGDGSGTDSSLDNGDLPPGVNATITGVTGASGAGGRFAVGDSLTVRFTLQKDDGSTWDISELGTARSMFSGPSFNYQRVIVQQSDIATSSVQNSDGSYSYTYTPVIPAVYEPPLNDTPAFGPDDGELTGQALLDGTYTVGMYFGWNYTVGPDSHRDTGSATFDLLLGGGAVFQPREVVKTENCNQCHVELQLHGGLRKTTKLCLLCHTAGAEDKNDPAVAGGTPGVTIDFRVMVHKIHNGAHLASVLGVTTDGTGARDYTATPKPYQLVGFGGSIHDYSQLEFPAWPNLTSPMPADTGHSALGSTEQALENEMRSGVTSCFLCHGDPDGSGPLTPPAEGSLAFTQPSRKACGSCHDDWIPTNPYTSNTLTMPPQASDSACTLCHEVSGSNLDVVDAHRHPLVDPAVVPGIVLSITSVTDTGALSDGDGNIEQGERIALTFTIQDDLGVDLDPALLASVNIALSGPTSNSNILIRPSIPTAALTGPQPFTVNVPERLYLEEIGVAGAGVDSFATSRVPHWNLSGATTEVYERGGFGAGNTTLAQDASFPTNFVDLVDATGFDRDDFVVLEDGLARQEYLKVQWVDGNRLWFSSLQSAAYPTGPKLSHGAGTAIREVDLALLTAGVEYVLDAPSGTIDETGGFTDGSAILVTYTSDYELPGTYPLALNAGPDLDESDGGWAGKSIVDGTYAVALWAARNHTVTRFTEDTSYREGARAVRADFLVGNATQLEPYDLISSEENCYTCHVDIQFHGNNRRGFQACLSCHGTAAAGDRPRHVAANAPETGGVTVNFREMLHKIHMGADLTNASSYVVVGFGFGWPNNFSEHSYEHVEFPNMPGGVKQCVSCHGATNTAWEQPGYRDHPSEQVRRAQVWRVVCGSCHDSDAAAAHIEAQTAPSDGAESCAICHGPGEEWSVEDMHIPR